MKAPFLSDPDVTIYCGDAVSVLRGLSAESVDCCVTSPPYWSLRDYSVSGQLGLEATPAEYVTAMVAVFQEVRRVLKPSGTVWLNLGDSYASSPPGNVAGVGATSGLHGANDASGTYRETLKAGHATKRNTVVGSLKPKDLVGIPWRVAFALQEDGWWLRSDIIWAKPNPMPESVTDRPTKAHEYVFLLSKSPRYFFDQEAVRDPVTPANREHNDRYVDAAANYHVKLAGTGQRNDTERAMYPTHPAGRNVRSVWEIATQPYPEAHFATFPEELARRCILAGSSERGVCPVCGAPWERETTVEYEDTRPGGNGRRDGEGFRGSGVRVMASGRRLEKTTSTVGWRASCDHDATPVPAVVLDPFLGSGTTALVARKHGRRAIGIELNEDYCRLAADRLAQQSLFAGAV